MALSEDITERKKAEQALRDAEEFQRRLIACSQDCIKVLDLEGRLLWMNEGGMQALEICDLGPFVNSSWIQFWEGEDAKAAQAAVEEARKGGTGRFTGYFATTTTKQPRWWDVVVSPILNVEGKPERLLAVSRDVTEHKRNEKALCEAHLQVARSEERWRSVFENSAIGVALTDLNGRFLATNPVYQTWWATAKRNSGRFLFSISPTRTTAKPTGRWPSNCWKESGNSFKSRSSIDARMAAWSG